MGLATLTFPLWASVCLPRDNAVCFDYFKGPLAWWPPMSPHPSVRQGQTGVGGLAGGHFCGRLVYLYKKSGFLSCQRQAETTPDIVGLEKTSSDSYIHLPNGQTNTTKEKQPKETPLTELSSFSTPSTMSLTLVFTGLSSSIF